MTEDPNELSSALAENQPAHELLLAQALDACIQAEHGQPGAAQAIIAQQPAWAQPELQDLVALASSLHAVPAAAAVSDTFRTAARGRLMAHITSQDTSASLEDVRAAGPGRTWATDRNGAGRVSRPGRSKWIWRSSAALFAAALGVAATVTASASALPGEPLYAVKEVHEDLGFRLASDDQARVAALLDTASARLDETSRLLQLGRTNEAVTTAQRFDQVVERATTILMASHDSLDSASTARVESKLTEQQDHVEALLDTAPVDARADLRQSLVAAARSLALLADAPSAPSAEETSAQASGPGTTSVQGDAEPVGASETATPQPVPTPVPVLATDGGTPPVVARAADGSREPDRADRPADSSSARSAGEPTDSGASGPTTSNDTPPDGGGQPANVEPDDRDVGARGRADNTPANPPQPRSGQAPVPRPRATADVLAQSTPPEPPGNERTPEPVGDAAGDNGRRIGQDNGPNAGGGGNNESRTTRPTPAPAVVSSQPEPGPDNTSGHGARQSEPAVPPAQATPTPSATPQPRNPNSNAGKTTVEPPKVAPADEPKAPGNPNEASTPGGDKARTPTPTPTKTPTPTRTPTPTATARSAQTHGQGRGNTTHDGGEATGGP